MKKLLLLLPCLLLAQTPDWFFRYQGPDDNASGFRAIVVDSAGNVYAAGYAGLWDGPADFLVLSISPLGRERWVYRLPECSGPAVKGAVDITLDPHGRVVAAGNTDQDSSLVTVVCLDTAGSEQWVYVQHTPDVASGWVTSCLAGPDGALYLTGRNTTGTSGTRFCVICIDSTGQEQWTYHDTIASGTEACEAQAACLTPRGVCAAGRLPGQHGSTLPSVVELTPEGQERWWYSFTSGDWGNYFGAVCHGEDGLIYAAGGLDGVLLAVALDSTGQGRFIYTYIGQNSLVDLANAAAPAPDSGVILAGYSEHDGLVISLTPGGQEQWVYRYENPYPGVYSANDVKLGPDGKVYAVGSGPLSAAPQCLFVLCLDQQGNELWNYSYSDTTYLRGLSLALAPDGAVYAGGRHDLTNYNIEALTIRLDTTVGMRSEPVTASRPTTAYPTIIRAALLAELEQDPSLSLFDASGREVLRPKSIPHGIYFVLSKGPRVQGGS